MDGCLKEKFPTELQIRDTRLHDDLGGGGQRIYTTAGQGYEKVKYVRADLYEQAQARIKELEGQLISGFYEDRIPHYTQGAPTHVLQEVMTAEEANRLITKIEAHDNLITELCALFSSFLKR